MAINHVLPLKAARRDALANLKWFWALEHQRPNVDGFIYIHYAVPRYSAHSIAIYLLPFGKMWLDSICRVQRLATKQNAKFTEGG